MGAFAERCAAIDLPWHPWPQALELAAGQDCPCFVFCGQALDAWSWRMADDLDGDQELKDLISATFVPCHIETVRDPGLAALTQQVLALSAGASGWPAVLFCLGDGTPLGAVPWSPMRDRDRRAGLATVCLELAEQWQQNPDALRTWGQQLTTQLAALDQLPTRPQRGDDLLLPAAESALLEAADNLEGGFGGTPRSLGFAPLAALVQRAAQPAAGSGLREHLVRSVDAILGGGCHDHLGGGIHRASQDAGWSLPFFEKRCGDQAQLALLLADTADVTGNDFYRAMAVRTLGWARAALASAEGPWRHGHHACTTGADGRAAEGATYAWTETGAAAIVGSEGARLFARRFLTGPEMADGFRIPAPRGELPPDELDRLPTICARLAQARAERPAPWLDSGIYGHEQGMALAACCRLAEHDPSGDWLSNAQALAEWLQGPGCGDDGLPQRHAGAAGSDAETLAWAARGLWDWHRAGDEPAAADTARSWAAALWALRREDGTLPQGGAGPGAGLPAVLDQEHGPSAAAVALGLFTDLGAADPVWAERAATFRDVHRPLLALTPLPAIGLLRS